eukprot:gene25369-biopygen10504
MPRGALQCPAGHSPPSALAGVAVSVGINVRTQRRPRKPSPWEAIARRYRQNLSPEAIARGQKETKLCQSNGRTLAHLQHQQGILGEPRMEFRAVGRGVFRHHSMPAASPLEPGPGPGVGQWPRLDPIAPPKPLRSNCPAKTSAQQLPRQKARGNCPAKKPRAAIAPPKPLRSNCPAKTPAQQLPRQNPCAAIAPPKPPRSNCPAKTPPGPPNHCKTGGRGPRPRGRGPRPPPEEG